MWWVLVCIGAGVGMAKANSVQPEERAMRQRLEDQRSERTYRMRWRVRGWNGWQTYGRIEWESEDQRAFFLHERDAGERWADFYTMHYTRRAKWGEIALGDVRPKAGGGMLWGRGRHGMPTERWSLRESRDLGYRSTGENGIVRGVAWRHQVAGWKWMIAGGRAHFDARLGPEGDVVSLPKSGLHRTPTERDGRRLLYADAGGGSVERQSAVGKLGMSFQYAQFSRRLDLRRRGRTPWDFTGVRQALWSMHGSRTGRFGAWSMELGRDARGHWAGIAQGVLRYSARSFRLLIRLYEPGFYAPFSSVPSAVDGLNELGVALVVESRQGSAYVDVYRRPARSYYVPFPSTHISWGGERRWGTSSRQLLLALRGTHRSRWKNERIAVEMRTRMRLAWTQRAWTVQTQWLHWNQARSLDEWGRAVSLRWRNLGQRVRSVIQLSTFWTDSYRSRMYEYEYDLPGTVSFRPLYGKGVRAYLLVGRRWKGVEWSFRYRLQRDRQWRHHIGGFIEWAAD